MFTTRKNIYFVVAIVLQILIILLMILFKFTILSSGTPILLKIAPVDPTDPLRGDYVTFRYDISTLNIYNHMNADKYTEGQTLYIPLRQTYSKYWQSYREPSTIIPQNTRNDVVYLKGIVSSVRNDTVRMEYGIEEYFIPEGSGRTFSFWNHEASALVYVDDNGNAVLKQLYIDDAPWP